MQSVKVEKPESVHSNADSTADRRPPTVPPTLTMIAKLDAAFQVSAMAVPYSGVDLGFTNDLGTWAAGVAGSRDPQWSSIPQYFESFPVATPKARWVYGYEGAFDPESVLLKFAPQVTFILPGDVGLATNTLSLCFGLAIGTAEAGVGPGRRWQVRVSGQVLGSALTVHFTSFQNTADTLNWEILLNDRDRDDQFLDVTWLGLGATPTVLCMSATLTKPYSTYPLEALTVSVTVPNAQPSETTGAGVQFVKVCSGPVAGPARLQGAQNVCTHVVGPGEAAVSWTLPPTFPTAVRTWTVRDLRRMDRTDPGVSLPAFDRLGQLQVSPVVNVPFPCRESCAVLPYVQAAPLPPSPSPATFTEIG